MLGLIIKDFLIQKRILYLSAAYSLVFLMFLKTDTPMIGLFMGWSIIWFNLSSRTFALDEKNKSETILNSLPLSKVEIIVARYLSSLAFLVYATLTMSVVYLLGMRLTGLRHSNGMSMFSMMAIGLVVFSVQAGCLYPIHFRFGYLKSMYAIYLIFFIPFLSIPLLKMLSPGLKTDLAKFLLYSSDITRISLALFFSAALIGSSILVSLRLYRSREF
jgi:ABC-2 type transport system permease protein